MKPPLVSILVLNWNGEKVIRKSLKSIRELTYSKKQVIVIDNHSTDSSIDIIRKEFPEFELVQNPKNLGFAAGMNEGIRKAEGSLILLYNNDAISHPSSLSVLVNRTLSDDSIGMLGGLILFYEPSDTVWSYGGVFDIVTGTIWSEGLGMQYQQNVVRNRTSSELDYLSGCVLLIRKEVFQKIGLLDGEFFMNGDDIDFCLRARRAGYDCFLDSSAIIWHIGSHTLKQMPLKSYVERQKSDFRTILLHVPTPFLISALFFQLFVMPIGERFLFKDSQMSTRIILGARVFAFSQNLKNLRRILLRRKQIEKMGQLKLKIRTWELFRFGLNRIRHKEYFMGRMFQKNAYRRR